MKKYSFIILSCVFVLSCSEKKSVDSEKGGVNIVSSFLEDIYIDKYSYREAVEVYFVDSEVILSEYNERAFILYELKIKSYLNYLKRNFGDVEHSIFWNEDILTNKQNFWILDTMQCEETLLVVYNDSFVEDVFCCCFRKDKIYSIFPLDDDNGGVDWAREFQLVE